MCDIFEHSKINSIGFTPHDTKWIPNSARFVVLGATAKSTGRLSVYDLSENGITLVESVELESGLKCGTFGAHTLPRRLLATGNLSGELELWDLERLTKPQSVVHAHDSAINAIDGCGSGLNQIGPQEIVTGCRDGAVKVWDTRVNDAVAVFDPNDSSTCECWSVAFGNSYDDKERCILAGYENGDIKLFDLRTGTIRYQERLANGICGVEFDRKDIAMNKFAVACLESQLITFDARTEEAGSKIKSTHHNMNARTTIWGVRHTPQNREISAVLLGDGSVEMYKYEYPADRRKEPGILKRLASRSLASQPINAWDWHREKQGLAVCTGFDQVIRVVLATGY